MKTEFELKVGKYYTVTYKYNDRRHECFGRFERKEFGLYYFKEDSGDWLLVKPEQIMSIK